MLYFLIIKFLQCLKFKIYNNFHKGDLMKRDIFENISPLDHRYSLREKDFNDYTEYFSETATIKYQAQVELALVKALEKREICSPEIV